MLKGNNLIWKSRQTTIKGKFPVLQYMPVNKRLLWKHKHWQTCHGNIYIFLYFIDMLPRKFKDPALNSMTNWSDWVIVENI